MVMGRGIHEGDGVVRAPGEGCSYMVRGGWGGGGGHPRRGVSVCCYMFRGGITRDVWGYMVRGGHLGRGVDKLTGKVFHGEGTAIGWGGGGGAPTLNL